MQEEYFSTEFCLRLEKNAWESHLIVVFYEKKKKKVSHSTEGRGKRNDWRE